MLGSRPRHPDTNGALLCSHLASRLRCGQVVDRDEHQCLSLFHWQGLQCPYHVEMSHPISLRNSFVPYKPLVISSRVETPPAVHRQVVNHPAKPRLRIVEG